MKGFLILLFTVFGGLTIFSQNTPKPEFTKRPYYYEDGKLKSLPKEETEQKGVYNTKYILTEKESSVSFSKGETIELIFEISAEQDVDGIFKVVIGEVSKNERTFNVGGFKAFGGKSKNNSENELPFEITRIEGNIYKMIIENVPNGEYAVVPIRDANALLSYERKVFIYTFSVK